MLATAAPGLGMGCKAAVPNFGTAIPGGVVGICSAAGSPGPRCDGREGVVHGFLHGFTLIEVMVVLVILALTVSVLSFSIAGMGAREVAWEIDRLRLVLEVAGNRAATHGTPIRAEFLPGRYRFSELNTEGQWRPMAEGDPLAERVLPETLSWAGLTVEGQASGSNPALIFGAEMPRFELRLNAPEGERIYHSRVDGSVILEGPVKDAAP
jgi:general secretion pathway protein H